MVRITSTRDLATIKTLGSTSKTKKKLLEDLQKHEVDFDESILSEATPYGRLTCANRVVSASVLHPQSPKNKRRDPVGQASAGHTCDAHW